MSPAVSTFLFQTVNFLALAALLSWVLFKPVRKALADRRAAEDRRRSEVEARFKEAEATRDAAMEERRSMQSDLDALRAQALARAEKEAAAIRTKAAEAAAREEESARRRTQRLGQSEMELVSQAAADAARELVRKLLSDIEGPDLERALVSAVCKELRKLGAENLRPVTVESASPLTPEARNTIEEAAGGGNGIAFLLRPDLGAGLRIRTARGDVDASAQGLSAYAKRELERHLAGSVKGEA